MLPHRLSLILLLQFLWPLSAFAANFTFDYGLATQCDDFQVSWRGGVPPFRLTILPSFGTPKLIDIPDNSFSNNQGSFNATLPVREGHTIIAVMSDATGLASGGISKVITVGKSVSNSPCNTTDPGPNFTFSTPDPLVQCRNYRFNEYNGAVQPITITGFIPGGSSFVLNPPKGAPGATFNWAVDVAAGTTVLFSVEDSQGRQGGSSDLLPVVQSGDNSCLLGSFPSSVFAAPSMTATSGSGASGTGSSSHTSAGVIAAAIAATLVAVIVIAALLWFFFRRRRRGTSVSNGGFFGRKKREIDLMYGDNLPPPSAVNPYPLQSPQLSPQPSPGLPPPPNSASSADALLPMSPARSASAQAGRPNTIVTTYQGSQWGGSSADSYYSAPVSGQGRPLRSARSDGSSSAQRKGLAGDVSPSAPMQRFVVHTDLEDAQPEIIELPPQYTPRRGPTHDVDGGSGSSPPTDSKSPLLPPGAGPSRTP